MKITAIYDYFSSHRNIRGGSLAVLSIVFLCLLLTLHFSEDISDFLPVGTKEREEMAVYQNISGAERIYVLFSNPGDADRTVEAIDRFIEAAGGNDPEDWFGNLTGQIDIETISEVSNFVYENVPYFLTDADVERMDSLLADPGYIRTALVRDREALMFPSSSVVAGSIVRDPLRLFSPVLERLQASDSQVGFEMYDNYIFTPDMSRAVAMMDSPFGSSETENNSMLLKYLEDASRKMQEDFPDVEADIIGGPAIAVGNSSRIKKDSLLAVSLSFILIILLLAFSFKSVKNIMLIFLSVGWGLIFALGGLALFSDRVSIIVIGISSVILGIAINYPLHLIAHTAHQPDRRAALKEIWSPLVIGNITTVGAFLALIPLKSTALRDLGLFASLLLVGTIVFVLLYLPHYVSTRGSERGSGHFLDLLSNFSPEKNKAVVAVCLVLTILFSVYSFRTEFDSDISNINYMTEEQRRDMQYFEDLLTKDDTHSARSLYVYGKGSSYDEALEDMSRRNGVIDSLVACGVVTRQNEVASFIVSKQEQSRRLDMWKDFVARHQDELTTALDVAARQAGFADGAFRNFSAMVGRSATMEPQDCGNFEPLIRTVFMQNFTDAGDSGRSYVVNTVNVDPVNMDAVKSAVGDGCFEVAGLNEAMTGSLSDNFNYIGWACSLIVFFFLWFSFGRIELAAISFLPMAVSWVWILGLMAMFGIKFNIVNIILATFIFGQGDDYTIFMTEGCQYEYARRSPILASYKNSILQSAAIMFVGIGTLITARHPAMRSLAEVTIIGMSSVVLMAYLVPPLLFKFLTTKKGGIRRYPITLKTLFYGAPKDISDIVKSRYAYKGKEIERHVRRSIAGKASDIVNMDVNGLHTIELYEDGYGELALLAALSHPEMKIVSHIPDAEHRMIAIAAAMEMADNIEFKS